MTGGSKGLETRRIKVQLGRGKTVCVLGKHTLREGEKQAVQLGLHNKAQIANGSAWSSEALPFCLENNGN